MLLENLSAVYKRMSHAALRAGRNPEEVRLVAVTKNVDAAAIRSAIDLGLRIFGESRVQEARAKILNSALRVEGTSVAWHLIGHLQRNKARQAVELFDLIHTVDSETLADSLDREAEKAGKLQSVLVQVKLSHEESKHGVSAEGLLQLLERVRSLPCLALEGLMTVPPYYESSEHVRPYFRRLREIRDDCVDRGFRLRELSMGMSHDFEAAIEEGSTMVRVGTAIFGERRP